MRVAAVFVLIVACGGASSAPTPPVPEEPDEPTAASTPTSTEAPALPLLLGSASAEDIEAFSGTDGVLQVIRADGHLDQAAIRVHLSRLRAPLYGCMTANDVTAGEASVVFTIGPDGTTTVEDAHADEGSEYAVRECAKGWVELARGVNAFASGGVTQVEIRVSFELERRAE